MVNNCLGLPILLDDPAASKIASVIRIEAKIIPNPKNLAGFIGAG